ncbi:hypothetical protein MMC30_000015 [Trapelia coarctata]|nr:hypothetical protein [Trapelia coarctata]
MPGIENANPTIRNASDLPTRRGRTSSQNDKKNTLGLFASSIPSSTYLSDPFEPTTTSSDSESDDENAAEPIDEQEIYDLISTISDPEHPLSLGSLAVVNLPDIHIRPLARDLQTVLVEITPTITHCSLATVIGLGVRTRLEQALPPRFRVDVRIKEGTHSTGEQVNKQLADKERVAAALENAQLIGVVRKMLETCQ